MRHYSSASRGGFAHDVCTRLKIKQITNLAALGRIPEPVELVELGDLRAEPRDSAAEVLVAAVGLEPTTYGL